MLSFTQSSTSIADRDDKYVKAGKIGVSSVSKLMNMSTFQIYAYFLMATSIIYCCLGGSIRSALPEDKIALASCLAEGLGLLSLRIKITLQEGVSGISGMTMVMYGIVYFVRLLMLAPTEFSLIVLDSWAIEVLQFASFLMVLDVVRSVFVTHRKSYQEDLDILHVKYLIPCCVLLAVPLHPLFDSGNLWSFCWTAYLYMDCLALAPQVVMMTQGAGKVEAPISHFVAATAISRAMDLWFWYQDFDLGTQGFYHGFNYSGWLIVFWHVVSLAIVADFMYYYVKARMAGNGMSEDLALPVFEV